MKIKFLAILCLFAIFLSCKKKQENLGQDSKVENTNQEITEKDISKIDYIEFALDIKTEKAVENWAEYYTIQDIINNIKKGDLSFFANNEDVKTTLKNLKENIPEEANSESIYARLNTLETRFFRLESLTNLSTTTRPELIKNIEEVLIAFSTLNFQLNKKIENDSRIIEKP